MMKPKFKLIKYLLILISVFIFAVFLILSLGRVDETMEVWGEVSLQNNDLVFSPVEGFIDSIYVKEGQLVEKNQILALIRQDQLKGEKILCPGDGMIFSNNLNELIGRFVKKGEILIIITDPYQMGFQALVPEESVPFVEEGLEAVLFINAFPYQQFGTFQGVVTSISPAPELVGGKVFYPTTLLIKKPYVELQISDQGQRLFLKPGMRGKAKIITRSNISIMQKLFKRFLS